MSDLNITVDLSGVVAGSGGNSTIDKNNLPIKGRIVGLTVQPHSTEPDAQTAFFQIDVVEPAEYAGIEKRVYIRVIDDTPTGSGASVMKQWRTAVESVGVKPAALDAGEVTVTSAVFLGKDRKGKIAYFLNRYDPDNDDLKFGRIDFITPGAYAQRTGENADAAAPAGAARATGANAKKPAAAPALDELGGDDDEQAAPARPAPTRRAAAAPAAKTGRSAAAALLE
jgi:hypothetical protein